MDQKTALLYARMPEYRYLVDKTHRFIAWALQQVADPYLACSFGKDSAVLLDLVLQHRPDIPVVWITFPETRLLNSYDAVVAAWRTKHPALNLRKVFVDVAPEIDYDDKQAFPVDFDSYFLGITKEESAGRRITLKVHGKFYKKKSGMVRIAPLADWLVRDIAAYTCANDLPLLDSYKTEGFNSRTVSSITEDMYGFRRNQLSELKRRDPFSYNQLLSQHPALGQYA